MKNIFYNKILKNINNNFKRFLLENKQFVINFKSISIDNHKIDKFYEKNFFNTITNGSKFYLLIDEKNNNNNIIIFYHTPKIIIISSDFINRKVFRDIASFKEVIKSLNIEDVDYNVYCIKYIGIDNYYNFKIDNIIKEYQSRLKNLSYFNMILDNTEIKLRKEIVELVSNNYKFNKKSNDIFIMNNANYLSELTNDLNNIEDLKYHINKLKLTDIVKNIVTEYKGSSFVKLKELYYKEIKDNKEIIYRKILKYIYFNMISENIKLLKDKKYVKILKVNPLKWQEFKKNIFNNKILNEFNYLENANQFDIL